MCEGGGHNGRVGAFSFSFGFGARRGREAGEREGARQGMGGAERRPEVCNKHLGHWPQCL